MEAFNPVGSLAMSARVSAAGALVGEARGVPATGGITHTGASGIYLINVAEGFRSTRENSTLMASLRYDTTGAAAAGDEPNVRTIGDGTQVEVRTYVGGTLTDAPFTISNRRRFRGGQAFAQNDGCGPVVAGGNISAAGAIVGKSQGIASVGVGANVFAIVLAAGSGIPLETSEIKATITGTVAGVAVAVQTGPNAIAVVTFNSAGASVALPFSLAVSTRLGPGGRRRGPIGNTVMSSLIDVAGGVVTPAGVVYGLELAPTQPVRTGAGVFEYTLSNPIAVGDAVITVQPCQEGAPPTGNSYVTTEHVSATLVRVRTFNIGTPTDKNHYVRVERIGLAA